MESLFCSRPFSLMGHKLRFVPPQVPESFESSVQFPDLLSATEDFKYWSWLLRIYSSFLSGPSKFIPALAFLLPSNHYFYIFQRCFQYDVWSYKCSFTIARSRSKDLVQLSGSQSQQLMHTRRKYGEETKQKMTRKPSFLVIFTPNQWGTFRHKKDC